MGGRKSIPIGLRPGGSPGIPIGDGSFSFSGRFMALGSNLILRPSPSNSMIPFFLANAVSSRSVFMLEGVVLLREGIFFYSTALFYRGGKNDEAS